MYPSNHREKTVYLAGPITGLSFHGCTEWRNAAVLRLAEEGIKGLSPMRAKDFLAHLQSLPKLSNAAEDYEYAKYGVMATSRGIMTRDRFDCTRCDVLLVNLLGAKTVSIGTVMEIAWADGRRIPIIAAMEPDNIHSHGMVNEAIGFRVTTLNEALDIAIAILR